jgi:competence protein ComGC
MYESTIDHPRFRSRLYVLLLLISSSLAGTGCGLFGTHKKVEVPQLLAPLSTADSPRLIAEVNRLAMVQSIHGKVDIEFEDTSFAEVGIAEKYRRADGTVTIQRPGKIYLIISVPFIAKDIAQMTSNGETFRVAVLEGDPRYRRFVKGTNNATYEQLEVNGKLTAQDKNKNRSMSANETVSALSNLRPQHLTDALMINPIPDAAQSGLVYIQSEFYQEEPDLRLKAKKTDRVVRGYYLLEETTAPNAGQARLLRRFWFDRVSGIRLARIQTFDDRGQLMTDVSYHDEKPFGETDQRRLPSRVQITRPRDHYKLSITYQAPASVDIGREFQPEAFVLENRWQLPEVDLDARQGNKSSVTP